MKLSEIKGVQAINTVADLMEPMAKIATNKKIKELGARFALNMKSAKDPSEKIALKVRYAGDILRACPEEIIGIFAILDGVPLEEYEFDLAQIPKKIVEIINDPYMLQLFGLQSQSQDKTSFGSATESTEV